MSIEQIGVLELESMSPAAKSGDTSSFTQITFPSPFPANSKIVVIAQTQTFKDADNPGIRIADITPAGFKIRFNELMAEGKSLSDGIHYKETVAWKAATVGMRQTGTLKISGPGAPVAAGKDTSKFTQVTFPMPFPAGSEIGVTASVQTFNGQDTPGLRIADVTPTGFKIRLNELVAAAKPLSDGAHTEEVVSWVTSTTH
jgi:hypothetical protein